MDFSIFTDNQLETALQRMEAAFEENAAQGYLYLAASCKAEADEIRKELYARYDAHTGEGAYDMPWDNTYAMAKARVTDYPDLVNDLPF
jgi:hypothetical protein